MEMIPFHVPIFPSGNATLGDIIDKSWGVYASLQGGSHLYTFEGVANGNMSISIQTPANDPASHLQASIAGPSVQHMVCRSGWSGWNRRLEENMELSLQKGSVHFEPFGVGGYVSLGGCQAPFVESGTYTLRVWGSGRYSIGAGMVESFSIDELLTMSFRIFNTYRWTGQSVWLVLAPFLLTGACALGAHRGWNWRTPVYWSSLLLFQCSLLVSIQMIWLTMLKVPVGDDFWIPLLLHILHPIGAGVLLLFALGWQQNWRLRLFFVIMALFEAFACWLGFIVLPVLLLIAAIWPRDKYDLLTKEEVEP